VGWSLLWALARSQLRLGSPVVLDGVARAPRVAGTRRLAAEEGAAGRDPADNDDVTLSGVTTSTTVDQATLEQVSALGARRAVIHLGAADLTEARAKLRQAADRAHLKG